MKQINDFLSSLPMTILAGIFLVISLALNLAGIPCPADPAWLAVVISGIPMLYLALSRLIRDHWVSSALLISIAMLASLAIGEIFAAGEVAFIMAIGAILEDLTVARAKRGLSKLIALAPSEGRRITKEGGSWIEEMIPAQQIRPGDLLRILPGEKIPADGMIRTGSTSVDQSILTGESLPADKTAGDSVFCGTLNCYGSIDIEAVSVGEDSSLQKLIALVKEAETKKAPMQRIADKWAVWLVPIALLIAVLGFLINWALGAGLMNALNRCVTVLVVFCPCALALATPVSVMAAIGQATKHGIIIKSGEALEKMGKVTAIAFDKTGTLTYGKLTVSDIRPFTEEIDACTLLFFTASAEAKSEHPLAKAITACAKEQGILLKQSSRFQMDAGKGIRAVIGANRVLCGSENYLSDHGVLLPDAAANVLGELRKQGKATILTALDGRCIGVLALSDVLKETAKDMIAQLAALDTKTVLLTGDNEMAADYFAGQLNITQVCAGLLPEQKVEKIAQLQQRYGSVCMIGDGVNDAPALKTADVGIAMGSMGSDIAVEAADIALMGDDISKIPYLKRLSRSAIRTIKGNITVSMCINFVAVTLSVLGVLNPVTGALVHNAGSVLVVLNAALLYDRNFEDT